MLPLQEKIMTLKKERGAIILAHYYQSLEVQDVADFVGDSFALAKWARDTRSKSLIMCGVRFMAESAKILSPDKDVYLPAPDAGCPMADMIGPEDVLKLRAKYPEAAVVCYVNSSAAVKSVSDICCTSSSAEKVVASRKERQIIFVPDKNLGANVAKKFPDREFIFFNGFCHVHAGVTKLDMLKARERFPEAQILVHPECREEVVALADYAGSTSGILEFARASAAKELIIGTELGVCYILKREMPEKTILPLTIQMVCMNMKKTTLESVIDCLEGRIAPLELSEAELKGAAKSLEAMVAI